MAYLWVERSRALSHGLRNCDLSRLSERELVSPRCDRDKGKKGKVKRSGTDFSARTEKVGHVHTTLNGFPE